MILSKCQPLNKRQSWPSWIQSGITNWMIQFRNASHSSWAKRSPINHRKSRRPNHFRFHQKQQIRSKSRAFSTTTLWNSDAIMILSKCNWSTRLDSDQVSKIFRENMQFHGWNLFCVNLTRNLLSNVDWIFGKNTEDRKIFPPDLRLAIFQSVTLKTLLLFVLFFLLEWENQCSLT